MFLLRSADYRRMPWKNGGGETIEIAVSPRGASVDNFDWRVSMARVTQDGPFSTFPGIDRTLAILDGEGIVLTVGDGAPVALTGASAPHAFAADVPTSARLIADPVLDLNVMTRRASFRHGLRRFDLTKASQVRLGGSEQLIFCTRSSVRIAIGSSSIDIDEGETLHRSGGATDCMLRPDGAATVFVVEIWPA